MHSHQFNYIRTNGWSLHKEGQLISNSTVLYQAITMLLGYFNALSTATSSCKRPSRCTSTGSQHHAIHIAQFLHVAKISSFPGTWKKAAQVWSKVHKTSLIRLVVILLLDLWDCYLSQIQRSCLVQILVSGTHQPPQVQPVLDQLPCKTWKPCPWDCYHTRS